MIEYIIACADVHIRNLKRHNEYEEQLGKFIDKCREMVEEHGKDAVRIVIAGDLLHNKLDISGEGYVMASWFLSKLNEITKTYVVAGNHDMNMMNVSRLDPITAIMSMNDFKNVVYLDQELKYESGCYVDDNVTFCLYSSFDKLSRPNIEEAKIKNPNNTFVGIFHGEVKSSKTATGWVSTNGRDPSLFEGVDFAILGHIHKYQTITNDGTPLVYCSSLIQQDHSENLSFHGYVVWDVEDQSYEYVNIENPENGFYTIQINGIEDLDEDREEILNL